MKLSSCTLPKVKNIFLKYYLVPRISVVKLYLSSECQFPSFLFSFRFYLLGFILWFTPVEWKEIQLDEYFLSIDIGCRFPVFCLLLETEEKTSAPHSGWYTELVISTSHHSLFVSTAYSLGNKQLLISSKSFYFFLMLVEY